MDNYYVLKTGQCIHSKWDKEIGEKHLDSTFEMKITKAEYDAITERINKSIRSHNSMVKRQIKKTNDLLMAEIMLTAGTEIGLDPVDVLDAMNKYAPDSYKILSSEFRK